MTDIPRWRERAKQKLEGYFHDQTFPRFTLSLIIMATGIFGFGISYFLLHAGMREMWVRYPIAVVGAYGIFILMLRVWVAFEKRRIDPEELAALEALQQGTDYRPGIENSGSLSRKHSWLDFVDLPVDGFGEGCLPLILIGAVIGIALLLFGVVAQAPALLAEVFVDVVLTSILYRRLRIAANQHWLGTAIRRTWVPVLVTAALLSIVGFCLTHYAPGAKSIGPALGWILH